MDEDRVKHAIAVARKMIQIAKDIGLSENEINDCFIIGYNHDVGYDRRLEDIKIDMVKILLYIKSVLN